MCELQRYGLQQALLRCGLTLCEDLMVHAPLLRAPERAQVLLAALHNPLLSDPACCKQLLPKLCHAVLAAPAAARRVGARAATCTITRCAPQCSPSIHMQIRSRSEDLVWI